MVSVPSSWLKTTVTSIPVAVEPAANKDLTTVSLFQAGNQAQGGRFSTPGRADQDHEFLVLDMQLETVNSQVAGQTALSNLEDNLSHD
jgi:hypothetical protein